MSSIQNGLQYFFRTAEDPGYVQNHYLLLASILAWAIIFLVAYKKDITKMNTAAIRFIGFSLFSLQVLITLWFVFARHSAVKDSMPLYFCRMSSLIIGFNLMRNKISGKVTNFFAVFSVVGASIALLVPDMEKYNFPHITGVSYIMIHSLLLLSAMYVVKKSDTLLSRNEIMEMTGFIVIPIHMFNKIFETNYSYTVHLPSILGVIPSALSVGFIYITTVLIMIGIQKLKVKMRNDLREKEFFLENYEIIENNLEQEKVKVDTWNERNINL